MLRSCLLTIALYFATAMAGAQPCPAFTATGPVGNVASGELIEISGLVASRAYPGVLWAHNDSGDTARFFALGDDGADLGSYTLTGVAAIDWEDIAIAPGDMAGSWILYIGDIGDNAKDRPNVAIHMVPEPEANLDDPPAAHSIDPVPAMILSYPGGAAHDAETLLADPVTGDLFIVTKVFSSTGPKVFRKAAPHAAGAYVLEQVADSVTGPTSTGGEISPAGDAIVVRNYTGAYIWARAGGQTVAQALAGTRCSVPLPTEKQGESLCFTADGCALLTVSEGIGMAINRIERNGICATASPTETATESASPTPTETATQTATPAATETPTDTASAPPTDTATPSPTDTDTPTLTATPTPTATDTETATPAATETPTDTESATPTDSATPSPTDTDTPTPAASPTPTATDTETATPAATESPTDTASATPTATDTPPPTPSATPYQGRPFADFDHSGCTDVPDFLFLLDHWQEELDGILIAVQDFLALLDNWLTGPACDQRAD